MLKCRECGIERDELYFALTKGKWYFTKRCKVCLGYKNIGSRGKYIKNEPDRQVELKLEKKLQLSKECLEFLNSLKRSRGYIDMLGAYKLAHYFTEVFGYIDLTYMEDIEEELLYMLNNLLKVKKKLEL